MSTSKLSNMKGEDMPESYGIHASRIAGDIRQMFHQLLTREEDRQSQRFLWRFDPAATPDIYVMDVATFGATCSPCSAQYVKNLNAEEFSSTYPVASKAIIHNTYVNDFLASIDTIHETVKLTEDVRTLHSKAGFEIRNWQSNDQQILRRVGGDSLETFKSFSIEKQTTTERILGMMWVPAEDVFVFIVQFRDDLQTLLTGEVVPTKTRVLCVVMSLFDPLGIISTYTIHGKILIQDVWRSAIDWDDPLCEQEFIGWRRWVRLAPDLVNVKVPRCYFPNYDPSRYGTTQLHLFSDASELACCAVAYFRIVDRGSPRCTLISAKAKVTPLRPQSIPRNKLNAGVIAVRLLETILENHDLPISKRFIWTDSTTALSWLKADPRKYRQYVGFRVAEILAETEPEEWRWVPTRLNPADKATKWGSGPCFDPNDDWYRGPDFLRLAEEKWPTRMPDPGEPVEELRADHVHREEKIDETLFNVNDFSRLDDLIKFLSYLYHFVHLCRLSTRTPSESRVATLVQQDYTAAEKCMWKIVQKETFRDEIALLQKNANLPLNKQKYLMKSSPLIKVSPFLDDDGVLRARSRIDPKAEFYEFNFRNPIILPRQSHVGNLLIQKYHERYGHANVETVVNELRQRYYVPKLRSVVKKIVGRCMWCRVYRAKPEEPPMAPLPQARVNPYVRPFTFTGLDYFGPLVVKRGRSNVKRWVALFTCLTICAVHMEVAHTLSTESCKMAIRRFVARRGAPQQMFSDNGTNFRGAARKLNEEIRAINRRIAGTFTNADTEWHFNPPSAPHMGGVWERKVRSVKEALNTLVRQGSLDDEGLLTFLAEAEMLVNSHPLTFVPLESPDQELVTPNNFLVKSSSGANSQIKIPINDDANLRTNWKRMQFFGPVLEMLDQVLSSYDCQKNKVAQRSTKAYGRRPCDYRGRVGS
ncbi:uncharacterized protein LOC129766258 [Toxorhynchites rutilus septentrionalis]|uniref:uncharacterized protein LOC129766258 n=1 Tax=Toxorhynchites rutilus septentrionalis TaxID=329112 RepID=UPI00247AACB7|nr:uncharacterized protein LOC129766258 [Toxorhynchites rutilus septentrionalis]